MTRIPDRQEELEALVRTEDHGAREPKPQPDVGKRGRVAQSDERVIQRCRKAKDAKRFTSLFDRGETFTYGDDHSRAELALVSMLCRFTRDAEQLDRLVRQSALCRAKWTEREDYRRRTIERALAHPPTKPGPSREVHDALDAIEAAMWRKPWPGKTGQSQWKIKHGVIAAAREYGEMIPVGVRVEISHRQLAERAGVSRSTINKKNLGALRRRGDLRGDSLYRHTDDAGAFVLLLPEGYRPGGDAGGAESGGSDCANPAHPTTGGGVREPVESGPALRSLRSSVAGVKRLGPQAGRAIEALILCGGKATVREVRDMLGVRYPRDARRVLRRLAGHGVVVLDGDRAWLAEGWQERLEKARRAGLEDLSAEVQEAQHRLERQRRAHARDADDLSKWRLERARKEHEAARDRYAAARDRRDIEERGDRA